MGIMVLTCSKSITRWYMLPNFLTKVSVLSIDVDILITLVKKLEVMSWTLGIGGKSSDSEYVK